MIFPLKSIHNTRGLYQVKEYVEITAQLYHFLKNNKHTSSHCQTSCFYIICVCLLQQEIFSDIQPQPNLTKLHSLILTTVCPVFSWNVFLTTSFGFSFCMNNKCLNISRLKEVKQRAGSMFLKNMRDLHALTYFRFVCFYPSIHPSASSVYLDLSV